MKILIMFVWMITLPLNLKATPEDDFEKLWGVYSNLIHLKNIKVGTVKSNYTENQVEEGLNKFSKQLIVISRELHSKKTPEYIEYLKGYMKNTNVEKIALSFNYAMALDKKIARNTLEQYIEYTKKNKEHRAAVKKMAIFENGYYSNIMPLIVTDKVLWISNFEDFIECNVSVR